MDNHQPQRTEQRVKLEIDIDLFSKTNFFTGFLENISPGGLFVATAVSFRIGQPVMLSFRLPNASKPIEIEGEIRWVRNPFNDGLDYPGVGVKFTHINETDTQLIEYFIKSIREPYFLPEEGELG